MLDVLPLKLASPLYVATTGCVAAASVEVTYVATPALNVDVLTGAPSILNVTVPDGLPAPGVTAVTVAVNVTDCPNTDGFGAEVRLVVVAEVLSANVAVSV